MLAEGGEGRIEAWIVGAIRNGPFHQLADTIAHKSAHIVDRMLRHAMGAKGVIDRCRQIA